MTRVSLGWRKLLFVVLGLREGVVQVNDHSLLLLLGFRKCCHAPISLRPFHPHSLDAVHGPVIVPNGIGAALGSPIVPEVVLDGPTPDPHRAPVPPLELVLDVKTKLRQNFTHLW